MEWDRRLKATDFLEQCDWDMDRAVQVIPWSGPYHDPVHPMVQAIP